LTDASFRYSTFVKNDVTDAVWVRTAFRGSQINDMVIEGLITDCSFENCEFRNLTFRNVEFRNVFFKGKPMRRVKFENCASDNISYAFLKNAKANLGGISVMTAGTN